MAAKKTPQAAELGDDVKDKVTNFRGIVTAMTYWLNGCIRLSVQPRGTDKEGKPHDTQVFDIEQLVVVKKKAVVLPPRITGGDRPDVAKRHPTPRR